jgi:hypothetical protein
MRAAAVYVFVFRGQGRLSDWIMYGGAYCLDDWYSFVAYTQKCISSQQGVDPGFVGPEACGIIFKKKKNYEYTTRHESDYLGPLPRPWKWPVQVRGPEA